MPAVNAVITSVPSVPVPHAGSCLCEFLAFVSNQVHVMAISKMPFREGDPAERDKPDHAGDGQGLSCDDHRSHAPIAAIGKRASTCKARLTE